ncbi:MAG: FAD-dependent oxidoreductase [Erysipelotrichaceae bacterium]|nr:FAD-dependent oxidoreductase [Erysipelotrichaceae bacterium]MDY5251126.1 FAD-dependent oxidoreductase [Erysipelotrichaceae bacterium]
MKNYDVVIVGGGIGGLMCAYRLMEKKPNLKVILFERGHALENRRCPIVAKKTKYCVKCDPCNIMEGMGGAGAFSDGKYIISTEYGGWLTDVMEQQQVIDYIEQADDILVSFGATKERYQPDNELKKECLRYDLHMQQAQVKHLGTDANFDTMVKLVQSLQDKVEICTMTTVLDVDKATKVVKVKGPQGEYEVCGNKIIFAVGRAGSRLFASWCKKNGVELSNNQVDIGVRVELPSIVWEHFSKKIYEPKIFYRSEKYGDITRMFCFNERGHVVTENTDGVLTVNGHSFKDEHKKSPNSNFALLSTTRFTEPFNEPIEYARFVASLANKISGGSVLVQRLGDLENGKRTDAKRLQASTVRPTLDAVAGDLSLCMPKRQLDNIIETLHALDKIAPGTANYDTLLYGVECKFYSARPKCVDFELVNAPGFYALGDGAGFTRSLSQAAANGLIVADILSKTIEL